MTTPDPAPAPSLRDRIAAALSAAGAFCGNCGFEPGDRGKCADCERCWSSYADAVLPLVAEARADAHPPVNRWYAEVLDGDHWLPYSSPTSDRTDTVRLLQAGERSRPTWDDGTPVQRRLIRETTTCTVEDARADAEDGTR